MTTPTTTEQLNQQIKDQGDVVRRLKADQADKDTIQPELDNLFQLKLQLAQLKGEDGLHKGKGKAKKAFTLKTPKVNYTATVPISLVADHFDSPTAHDAGNERLAPSRYATTSINLPQDYRRV